MRLHRPLALLLCAAALTACGETVVRDITGTDPGARIKFFNFGVNAPGVNFYANDTKMTAISSTTGQESPNGVTYGNAGSGGLYAAIAPGQYTVSGRIAAATDKDLAISTVPATVGAGKHYSFYQSGFYNATTKTVDGFVVEDNFPSAFDYTGAYVRFVNAISNSQPMTLHGQHTDSASVTPVIGGAVAYKSAGEFVRIPGGSYNITARLSDGSTAITRAGVSFSAGRVYTITARGDMTVTSTTATNRPVLDNTANR
jgi:hypothetical protein